jgi:hypothetical protein
MNLLIVKFDELKIIMSEFHQMFIQYMIDLITWINLPLF